MYQVDEGSLSRRKLICLGAVQEYGTRLSEEISRGADSLKTMLFNKIASCDGMVLDYVRLAESFRV